MLLFGQTLPFVEEFILAAQRAYLGFRSVGEDQESIVVEQVGNGVLIVGIVVGVCILHIYGVLLQFDEQQRDTVDKTDNIRTATVQITVDLQLLNGEEVVVSGVFEVDDGGVLAFRFASGFLHGDGDTVTNEEIFFLVDLQQRRCGQAVLQGALSLVHLGRGDPRIQAQQSLPKIPGQQDILIAFTAKRAVFAQLLSIVGKSYIPAKLVMEQMTSTFLHKYVFGIVIAHIVASYRLYQDNSQKRSIPLCLLGGTWFLSQYSK